MRIKDIKKAGTYFGRILKDPFSRQSRAALGRYFTGAFSLLYERIRGLDYTMVYQYSENEHNNNYSKSPKKVLKRIFADIDFNEAHSFIDLGCGKGYVMTVAADYPFEKISGVEFSEELCAICRKNLRIKKLDRVGVYHGDAKAFQKYGDYDIFYFCNPFDETILSVVAKKILEAHRDSKCRLYYLNPHQEERQQAIRDAGFTLKKVIRDRNESYFDCMVYEN